MQTATHKNFNLTATQTIAGGFAMIILFGALLLILPVSNRSGEFIPFINALFTATSATCVTGLVVYDTWTQFTVFGQAIILLLIQIGGLGFMTVLVLFFLVMKKRIGLKERELISESISSLQIGGIVRMAKRVLIGTAFFELSGAVLLAVRFIPQYGFWPGIWNGLFHSVSAFCNAGFDIMGKLAPYTSLVPYQSDPLVNFVIMGLIVIGGIGFVVWNDLWTNRRNLRRTNLHTKLMLTSTVALILGAAAVLVITEWNASMRDMPLGTRVLASLFQSVTPRTAGFNTIDTAAMSDAGSLFTMLLMFVGAGPGSTAGGIKVTTAVLLILSVLSYVRGSSGIDAFHRRIDPTLFRRAFCTALFYFLLVLTGTMIILIAQPLPLRDILVETFSAFGTVGLSTGVTRELSNLSRVVIILLMYSGRIGSLTVILSVSERASKNTLVNPTEKIIVG